MSKDKASFVDKSCVSEDILLQPANRHIYTSYYSAVIMPPPKKPKTGLSRVEEFLTASEKEELASQGSVHSPDCSSPSHTEELVWRANKAETVSVGGYDYRMQQQHDEQQDRYTGNSRRLADLMQTRKVDALFHALQAASPPPTMDSFCRPSLAPPPSVEALQPARVQVTPQYQQLSAASPPYSPSSQPPVADYRRASVSPSPPRHHMYDSPQSSPRHLDPALTSVGPYIHWQSDEEEEEIEEHSSSNKISSPPSPAAKEQEVPLDFSQTAKSVLARMMASAGSIPAPPQHELVLPRHRRTENNFSHSSPTHAWPAAAAAAASPPSDDSRSLSPGEWRPGMPPSVSHTNLQQDMSPPSGSNRDYQQEAPPSAANTYHMSESQVLPSGDQSQHWKATEHYTRLPSSGHNRQWEPEESSSNGEVKEPTISSTSNLTDPHPHHHHHHQHEPQHQQQQVGTACDVQHSPSVASAGSVQEMPTSTMTEERKVGRPRYMDKGMNCQRRCQICNDMASGFHYGVWSCEGCKAFFKRSLQGTPVEYVCPATNSCTIDKHRRKSCQACRLRKCLEMGMNRGKKGPRGPRGPNKRKLLENGQIPLPITEAGEPRIKIKKEVVDMCEPPRPAIPTMKGTDIHPLAEYLIKIDPPTRHSGHDNLLPDDELNITTSLMKLADTELVDVINWAKSIPGYTDLQLRDRIHLLEASWMEILMMGILWRSHLHSTDNNLVFAPDLHIDKQRSMVSGISSVCEKMFGLASKFSALQINKEELVLLRTLLLFNAEIADLPSCAKIESLREKLIEALQYTSCERIHKSPERVAHLLLFLPHIRQCSLTAISRMFELGRKHQSIPSFELLQEMIEARSPMVLPPVMCRHLLGAPPPPPPPPPQQLSPRSSHIPSSPPLAMGAPAHYNGSINVSSHLNSMQQQQENSSVAVSSYHMSLPQPRMSHHQQPQHPQLPPQTLPQPLHPSSTPVTLPHRYTPMSSYPPTPYNTTQK